jgi:4a-hydroxytetrahydrobiopterin dehydratase
VTNLAEMHCKPVRKEDSPLADTELPKYAAELPGWTLRREGAEPRLECVFRFRDFAGAMAFAVRIGELAEAEDHHPLLQVEWGRVTVSWWTHRIHGLHLNDFIMAAKTDRAYPAEEPPST